MTMVAVGPPQTHTLAYQRFLAKVQEVTEERKIMTERQHSQAELEAARAKEHGGAAYTIHVTSHHVTSRHVISYHTTPRY